MKRGGGYFYGLFYLCNDNYRLEPELKSGRSLYGNKSSDNCPEAIRLRIIPLF